MGDEHGRRQVEALAGYGVPEVDIARVVSVDPKTLRKHYRDELDLGATKATAKVAEFLFRKAHRGPAMHHRRHILDEGPAGDGARHLNRTRSRSSWLLR